MSKAESADLLMKLYELRREATMREGRNWYAGSFFPESVQDIVKAMTDPASSAYFRMVASYWDMAASFVNHGAIDEEMFNDVSGESLLVFAKVQPFLAEMREMTGARGFMKQLETLIMKQPDAENMIAGRREMINRMKERMQAAQKA